MQNQLELPVPSPERPMQEEANHPFARFIRGLLGIAFVSPAASGFAFRSYRVKCKKHHRDYCN